MRSVKKQCFVNGTICEKSGMESGPKEDLERRFSWEIGFDCDFVSRREINGNDFVRYLARGFGPKIDCVPRLAREAYFEGARGGTLSGKRG